MLCTFRVAHGAKCGNRLRRGYSGGRQLSTGPSPRSMAEAGEIRITLSRSRVAGVDDH
ncbi:hypothetical protein [Nocardia seriolae]|uniref:hypothetical protein n=1 Tax=Nocardia seriolae TaxID=37332 RepID=UPI001E2C09F1|nr:hypothetical protein [Nocardia seriolae]WNJ62257.1 hypothetical protein RMO66_17135 [Nocardia seriolae]